MGVTSYDKMSQKLFNSNFVQWADLFNKQQILKINAKLVVAEIQVSDATIKKLLPELLKNVFI